MKEIGSETLISIVVSVCGKKLGCYMAFHMAVLERDLIRERWDDGAVVGEGRKV